MGMLVHRDSFWHSTAVKNSVHTLFIKNILFLRSESGRILGMFMQKGTRV